MKHAVSLVACLLPLACSGQSIDIAPHGSAPGSCTPMQEVSYPLDSNAPPATIAAGNMDGDGHIDLVAGNYYGSYPTISVLLNRGDGRFNAQQGYSLGDRNPFAVALGDFNGDGRLDVASVTNTSLVDVSLNTGSGSLAPSVTFDASDLVGHSLAVADLDGDQDMDIVVAGKLVSSEASLVVLFNSGDATFSLSDVPLPTPVDPNPGPSPLQSLGWQNENVAVADFDRDGKPDIAVMTGSGGYSQAFAVLFNQGNGTFMGISSAVAESVQKVRSLNAADLNGDAYPDLVLAGLDAVGVLLNDGSGHFAALAAYTITDRGDLTSAAIADVDGDGFPEIVVADDASATSHYRDDALIVFHNQQDGTFVMQNQISAALPDASPNHDNAPFAIVSADLNGDMKPDFAVANQGMGTAGVFLSCP